MAMSALKIMVTPDVLTKHLVGDKLQISVQLNPKVEYEVEAVSTAFGTDQGIPLSRIRAGMYRGNIQLRKSGFYGFKVRYRPQHQKRWRWLVKQGKPLSVPLQIDPAWLAHAIVYNVFVRFFKGKVSQIETAATQTLETGGQHEGYDISDLPVHPGDGGTFDDVKAYLDTLVAMHINTLYFNPIHVIGELYRGYNMLDSLPSFMQPGSPYSIKDYKSIDPELTYDRDTKKHLLSDPYQEFGDLVEAAHERGMFIVMDMVFNHTAHDFVFQRIKPEWYLYKEDITSLSAPYLYPEDAKAGKPWGDARYSMAPYDHGIWWKDCAQLNWEYRLPKAENEPPPNYSLNEMWEYFKSIPQFWIKRFGVDGFRCDVAYKVPPDFWKECIGEARLVARSAAKNRSRDVIFVAESYEDDLTRLQEAGFSAVYGDFSRKMQSPLTLKGYLDYMYNLSGNFFPEGSKWFLFPDSHDFERNPRKILGSGGVNADVGLLANQSRYLLTATLPGIPLLFNGFEKVEWQTINIMSYGAVDWERDKDLKTYIARVNFIRKHHPALQRGSYSFLLTNQGLTAQTQLLAFLRQSKEETLMVVVNMDVTGKAGPATIALPEEFAGDYSLLDLLTNQTYERSGEALTIILEPGQGHIFLVQGI